VAPTGVPTAATSAMGYLLPLMLLILLLHCACYDVFSCGLSCLSLGHSKMLMLTLTLLNSNHLYDYCIINKTVQLGNSAKHLCWHARYRFVTLNSKRCSINVTLTILKHQYNTKFSWQTEQEV